MKEFTHHVSSDTMQLRLFPMWQLFSGPKALNPRVRDRSLDSSRVKEEKLSSDMAASEASAKFCSFENSSNDLLGLRSDGFRAPAFRAALKHVPMMQQAIEHGTHGCSIAEHFAPVFHGAARREQGAGAFVTAHYDFKQLLGSGERQPAHAHSGGIGEASQLTAQPVLLTSSSCPSNPTNQLPELLDSCIAWIGDASWRLSSACSVISILRGSDARNL